MKCCGKEMYDNGDNFRCGKCGKRIYKPKAVASKICPRCGRPVYVNDDNIHCSNCDYREYVRR